MPKPRASRSPKPSARPTSKPVSKPTSKPAAKPAPKASSTPAAKPKAAPKPKHVAAKPEEGPVRLHVYIAHTGFCSRRAAEQLILEGRVEVNDELVIEMGVKVGPEDVVRVDGVPLKIAKIYTVLLNKPTGVVTTLYDPQKRPTIVRFLPDYGVPLKPVGRLDMDTEGLLICSNDGDLAHRLAHPSFGIEKEYVAVVEGIPPESALRDLRRGVFIEGRRTAPAKVEVIHAEEKKNTTGLRIIIHEGRKRQIRLMCELVGHPVKTLRRVRIGPLGIRGMRPGECRLLGMQEVNELKRLVGLPVG